MMRAENEDAKEDQIRKMAWFALWGLLVYPLGIILADIVGYETTGELLADIAPTYFVAIAGLVGAFFGAQAYTKGEDKTVWGSTCTKTKKVNYEELDISVLHSV